MATTPGRKKRADNQRANQYFEPGVVGRKTGITLPQNARDEHGIEDLDGIFSSPEKPLPQERRDHGNETLTSSDMELAQSSAPEPTEVLSTRRLQKNGKTVFPPPMGRSPHKTNLGSSPRRQSSVKPRHTLTPELLQPRPTVTRRLDFSTNGDVAEVGASALRKSAKRRSGVAQSVRKSMGTSPPRDLYTLQPSEDENEARIEEETRITEEPEYAEEEESMQLLDHENYGDMDAIDDVPILPQSSSPSKARQSRLSDRTSDNLHVEMTYDDGAEEEHVDVEVEETIEEEREVERVPTTQSRPRGRPPKAQIAAKQEKRPIAKNNKKLISSKRQSLEESIVIDEPSYAEPSVIEPVSRRPGRGKQYPSPPETQPQDDEALMTTELEEPIVSASASKRKRGRAPKEKLPAHEHTETEAAETEEVSTEPPSKRPKKGGKAANKKATKSKAPQERNATTMASPEFKKPALPARKGDEPRFEEAMWAQSRNMSRLRDPTPSTEAMVTQTRSGRQVIKPLNHYANEKAQYARDGTILSVQTAEVVQKAHAKRATTRGRSQARSRATSKARKAEMEVIEEDEDEDNQLLELEPWELNAEVHHGEVNEWDPMTAELTGQTFSTELAWGVNSVAFRPVSKANFGFAKLLSMPYFGTGIMDMPIDGFKRPKNAGRTALHIFVHTGKVWAKVAGDNEFTVTAGGSFHVPRGNMYEIRNVADVSARLFFAQGTETMPSDE